MVPPPPTASVVKQAVDAFYKHSPKALVKFNDFFVTRGEGSWVWTLDGRKLLDFNSGIGVTSTGHCHPRVVEAVREQAGLIVHAQQNIFGVHRPMAELTSQFVEGGVMPKHLTRFFLCNSGAEAVDNAVKVARAHTGRPNVIAFEGGFHGRTIGAMSLTTSKTIYREGFQPLMPGTFVAQYPYCLRCKVQEVQGHKGYALEPDCPPFQAAVDARSCCNSPLEALEWMFKMQTAPSETAAIILEPVLGEGGFLTPPPGFLRGLRQLCDAHGILLIADEVQAGAGRTGTWWGYQQFDGAAMAPDILIFAKGIASGYPLAGLATRDEHFSRLAPGALGGTYGGNAVACAAAVATVRVIREEGLLANAAARGTQLMGGLVQLAKHYPAIVDVRGRGLMVAVEFGDAKGGRATAAKKGAAMEVVRAAAAQDLLLMPAGARESIRFLPPLTVNAAEVDQALARFEAALQKVYG